MAPHRNHKLAHVDTSLHRHYVRAPFFCINYVSFIDALLTVVSVSCPRQMPLTHAVRSWGFLFVRDKEPWWWLATAQLSVPVRSHHSFCSSSLFSAVSTVRPSLALARGDARLDDFTTSTSTAVSWTNIAAPHHTSLLFFLPVSLSLHSLILGSVY